MGPEGSAIFENEKAEVGRRVDKGCLPMLPPHRVMHYHSTGKNREERCHGPLHGRAAG